MTSAVAVAMTATATNANGEHWLSVRRTGGSGNVAAFEVSVSAVALIAGTYTGSIVVGGGAASLTIPVTLLVSGANSGIFVEPASVSLISAVGQAGAATQSVTLRPGFTTNFSVTNVSTGSGGNWMSVSPMTGTIAQSTTIAVSANPAGLAAGTYQGSFVVTMAGVGSTTVPVTLAVTAPPGTTGLRFVPIAPCRMMETRAEYNFAGRMGAFAPPFLNAGDVRRFRPQNSTVCSIPAAAKAFSLNATLLPRGGELALLRVSPAGEVNPDVGATIWFTAGQVVANTAFVMAGEAGEIAVAVGEPADVLLDVNGYFVEENRAESLVYYPMAPCRVVETRAAYRQPAGPFGPPSLGAGERRTFAFRSSPHCQIPAGARAYTVSLTAVPDGPLAFLSLVPTGGAAPLVSSLNAFGGQVVSNHVIVPAGTDGSIDAFSYGKADVILDVTGYFAPDDGRTGLLYYPVTQCSVLTAEFRSEETKTVSVAGSRCGQVGARAKGYLFNVTVTPGGLPMPFLTVYPTGQARPGTSFLNAFEGQAQTNSVIVPAGTNGAVDLFAYRPTQVRVEVLGYFGR